MIALRYLTRIFTTDLLPLSPAARAILEAVTWKKYDVPPGGLPAFAEEIAPLIAIALRAAIEHCTYQDAWEDKFLSAERILAIAAELDGINSSNEDDFND